MVQTAILKRTGTRNRSKKTGRRSGAWYFWMGFLIPALLTLIGYIVISVWPFGDGTVLIIDSLHQYLPFYTDFHDKLQRGEDLFYSFSAGMGYDFWSTYAYYLSSPLNFLIALVPTANVGDFMDYMILFKIGLCGGTFAWYLHRRDERRRFSPVVFAVMYTMGNFIIGYYFNLMWLDSIAMVPLIMYGIEKIVKGEKGTVYNLSLFFALWCNYYIGFMLCIFSVLYFVVCSCSRMGLGLRAFLRRCLTFAWHSLLSGGMAAVLLVPAYVSLTSSESMESNSFPSVIRFYTNLVDLLTSGFAAQHPINISSTQVGLNAYCGMAVFILVLCYVLDEKIDLREKIGRLFLTVLLLLSFAMNILNYIWHGFHQQNGLPNRFAFLYILLLLIMCYDVLPHLPKMRIWKLAVSCVLPVIFVIWTTAGGYLEDDGASSWNFQVWEILTVVLIAGYALLLLIMRLLKVRRRLFCGILCGVMLAEAAAHGICGLVYNENVTRSIYLDDQASFKTLTGTQGDTDFYRSEIDSQRMRNVTMFAGGHSVVLFNSTMDASYTEFCDRIGMEARTNKNGYNGVTTLMNDVFGIRYVLSSNGRDGQLYSFPEIDSDSNLTLYYNADALSIGFMCRPEIRYWDTSSGNPLEVQNDFVNLAAGLEDLYVLDRTIEAENGETYSIKIPENKQVYLYAPSRLSSIVVDTPEYNRTYTTYTDHLYSIFGTDTDNMAEITTYLNSTSGTLQLPVYLCTDEDLQAVLDVLGESQLENVSAAGRQLSGEIDVQTAGIMLLTIPYDTDWKIKVDGETVQALQIGGALTGVELSEGTHVISMTYTPGGFYTGLILTILCTAAFMLTVLIQKKRNNRRKNMTLHFSKKADSFEAGIFTILNEKKEELEKQGVTIHNLSVGTPDFEPPENVMKAVSEAAAKPENYKYSLKEMPELISAMQDFYERRFGVTLAENEIMSVNGSQEGIAHIAWALCDPGDIVLVPNPGYPIFKIGPQLCGARTWEYPLLPENNYLPDLHAIPEEIKKAARCMIISYPGNPLCKAAPDSFYRDIIRFAQENEIILIHDNAYADIVFGEKRGGSFLQYEGAKEIGVEFYSLSKTFDYTGARLSFVVGNSQIVGQFKKIRSQIDYGVFYPVQYGAVAALREPDDRVLEQCAEYERRSRALCGGLRSIGWYVPDTDGTMFVWAPLPGKYTNSETFCLELMQKSGVICTPGSSFGSLGEGYVRFALVEPVSELQKAVKAIAESGMLAADKA